MVHHLLIALGVVVGVALVAGGIYLNAVCASLKNLS